MSYNTYEHEEKMNKSRNVFKRGFAMLFFGFLVFTASSFGGTIALGGLVSITLFFAMVSNLVLLPSLLLSLEQNIANKAVLKEPTIDLSTEDTK